MTNGEVEGAGSTERGNSERANKKPSSSFSPAPRPEERTDEMHAKLVALVAKWRASEADSREQAADILRLWCYHSDVADRLRVSADVTKERADELEAALGATSPARSSVSEPPPDEDYSWALKRVTDMCASALVDAQIYGKKLLKGFGYPNEAMGRAQDYRALSIVLARLAAVSEPPVSPTERKA